jgi:hypothetical protein
MLATNDLHFQGFFFRELRVSRHEIYKFGSAEPNTSSIHMSGLGIYMVRVFGPSTPTHVFGLGFEGVKKQGITKNK